MTDTEGGTRSSISLVEALTSFPSEGALFTTFTLSLTWFERTILPALERARARRVAILADPLGVTESARERLARGPGVRYALDSIRAPDGVFHPKVAVLWGRDQLMLVVGSGNLTFSGMQGNLEVVELFLAGPSDLPSQRRLSRPIAQGALSFLTGCLERLPPSNRSSVIVGEAMGALERWLPTLPDDGDVTWLDTFAGTIGAQLGAVAKQRANRFDRLSVLSPFHDPTAKAVSDLAQTLEVGDVEVLFTGKTTAFPVDRRHLGARPVSTSRLLVADDRTLHAKVFRAASTAHTLVLSGSPNATHQALWTQRNVEVGVARWTAGPLLFLDAEAATPTHAPTPEQERATHLLSLAWATYGSGFVRFGLRLTVPVSEVTLTAVVLGERPGEHVVVTPEGGERFCIPYTNFDPMQLKPMRLEVWGQLADGRRESTRCWIAFDELLEKSPEFRAGLHAMHRLLSGDPNHEADEDDVTLLTLFSHEHSRVIGILGSGARPGDATAHGTEDGGEADGPSDEPIALHLLEALPSALPGHATTHHGDRVGWLARVTHAMQVAFGISGGSTATGHIRVAQEDDEAPEERRLERHVRDALEFFEETFHSSTRALVERPKYPAGVLQYASLCLRVVLRYRARETALDPLVRSLSELVGAFLLPNLQQRRGPLLLLLKGDEPVDKSVLLTFSFAISVLAHLRSEREEGSDELAMDVGALREALATLDLCHGGPLEVEAIPEALAELELTLTDLSTAVHALRASECPSERALRLKRQLQSSATPTGTWSDVDRQVLRSAARAAPLFVAPWVRECPRCRRTLSTALLPALARREPIQCSGMGCSRWLVPSEAA